MPESGRDEHECRVAIGEGPDDLRPSPHFADDALERIIGADAPPRAKSARQDGRTIRIEEVADTQTLAGARSPAVVHCQRLDGPPDSRAACFELRADCAEDTLVSIPGDRRP